MYTHVRLICDKLKDYEFSNERVRQKMFNQLFSLKSDDEFIDKTGILGIEVKEIDYDDYLRDLFGYDVIFYVNTDFYMYFDYKIVEYSWNDYISYMGLTDCPNIRFVLLNIGVNTKVMKNKILYIRADEYADDFVLTNHKVKIDLFNKKMYGHFKNCKILMHLDNQIEDSFIEFSKENKIEVVNKKELSDYNVYLNLPRNLEMVIYEKVNFELDDLIKFIDNEYQKYKYLQKFLRRSLQFNIVLCEVFIYDYFRVYNCLEYIYENLLKSYNMKVVNLMLYNMALLEGLKRFNNANYKSKQVPFNYIILENKLYLNRFGWGILKIDY